MPPGPDDYHASWSFLPSGIHRTDREEFKPGQPPPVTQPPHIDSPEERLAETRSLELQLDELQDQGPIPIVLGEPKLIFSVTNGSGDIWQGFLELVGLGTNAPASAVNPITGQLADGSSQPLTPEEQIRLIEQQRTKYQARPAAALPPPQEYESFTGQPPVVVETFPVSGARDVAPGEMEIQVRFSKGMAHGSWSWSSAWKDSTPESLAEPHYLDDGRTCVLKVRLEPGKTYAWWLNSDEFKNFKDTAGLPAVPYLLIFQTKPN
jgi:hypothetical protein